MVNTKKNANHVSIFFENGVPENFVTDCLRQEHVLGSSGSGSNPVEFLLEQVPGESPFKLPDGFWGIVRAAHPTVVVPARCTI